MTDTLQRKVDEYSNLRTIPAVMGLAFALASLYQFGGIAVVELPWLGYTLTSEHAVFVSMGALTVAFASSETRSFASYDTWEQALIAAGPLLIIGHQYVPEVTDLIAQQGDIGGMIAFAISLTSWGVVGR